MIKLLEKVEAFRNNLMLNNRVSFIDENYREIIDADEEDIIDAATSIGEAVNSTIDPSFYDFVKICIGGHSFAWTHTDEDFLYGGVQFNDLWSSFCLDSDFWWIDFSIGSNEEIPPQLSHFKKLGWFEKQAWGADERFGCFIREKGVFPPQLAFFDRNWYIPLTLSLMEYLNAMIDSCAVRGWQYFYIDWNQEIPHKEKALADMKLAVTYLPKLFPEKDFSFHIKKLQEVEEIPTN